MTLIITCFVISYQYALKLPIVESFKRLFVSLIHFHILIRLFILQTSGRLGKTKRAVCVHLANIKNWLSLHCWWWKFILLKVEALTMYDLAAVGYLKLKMNIFNVLYSKIKLYVIAINVTWNWSPLLPCLFSKSTGERFP